MTTADKIALFNAFVALIGTLANCFLAFLAWQTIKANNETSQRLDKQLEVMQGQLELMKQDLGLKKRAENQAKLDKHVEKFKRALKSPPQS